MDREPQKWVPKVIMPLILNMRKDPNYYAKYELALMLEQDSWKNSRQYNSIARLFNIMKTLQTRRIKRLHHFYLIILYNFTKLIELLNPRTKFIFNDMDAILENHEISYDRVRSVSIYLFEMEPSYHGDYFIDVFLPNNDNCVIPPNGMLMFANARNSCHVYTKRAIEHMLNFYPFERFMEVERGITILMPDILKIVYEYAI